MTAPMPGIKRVRPDWGGPLIDADYSALAKSWITPELADASMLRRVTEDEGSKIVGQKGKRNCAGLLIPYYWPDDHAPVNYRIRRDKPDIVAGKDGALKEERKYLGAPGAANRLYVPPGITLEQLADVTLPIVIVEGEKKALALWRLANHEVDCPRFIVVAIPGVWSWLGVVGKTGGKNGERLDVKGVIPDLDRIAWRERTIFILFDRNVHTNESVKAARKRLMRHLAQQGGASKLVDVPEDCGVNGVDDLLAAWGPTKVLELLDRAVSGARLEVVPPPQFESQPEGMYRVTQQGEQLRRVQLTNYRASIKTTILLDDGADVRREFEIEAELHGRHFNFTVPASEFATMDWPIAQMGPTAITFPSQREYARTAIQSFSMTADEQHIYTHTGWRRLGDKWVYLHAGGAVSELGAISGIEVRLAGALGRYVLQLPSPDEVVRAFRASLHLARLGPAPICFPLLAATCRAVFGDADFALHLAGETGTFKSELAALYQRHFGAAMDRLHLPGAWSSTANALEAVAFHAKDTIFVVDDFAPHGSAADVQRYHAAADRLFRAAGNGAGRARLDSAARLREPKPPRSLILSTGEDIPKGHSVRARLLVLELAKGAIVSGDLTRRQFQPSQGFTQKPWARLSSGSQQRTKKRVRDLPREYQSCGGRHCAVWRTLARQTSSPIYKPASSLTWNSEWHVELWETWNRMHGPQNVGKLSVNRPQPRRSTMRRANPRGCSWRGYARFSHLAGRT
jgi:hypothetical protein